MDIINNLIPADDLYWNKEENKFLALSNKKIEKIVIRCCEQKNLSLSEIQKIVEWSSQIRVAQLLLKGFLNGNLSIIKINDKGEPYFCLTKELENELGKFN
jgi:uncharacterized protein YaiL (DUF2058 family)